MDHLTFSAADLQGFRFRYSPLVELGLSLRVVTSGSPPQIYARWHQSVKLEVQEKLDWDTLRLLAPPGSRGMAPLFLLGIQSPAPSLEKQLSALERRSGAELRHDLAQVWPRGLPPECENVVRCGGPALAALLADYWRVALAPSWPRVLGLLEEDVAYRARRLLATGLEGVLHDLSPEIAVSQGGLQVGTGGAAHSLVVTGSGLSLMPSAFAWASPTTGVGPGGVSVIYGARGVATLWSRDLSPQQSGADTLAELLGRNRAAILQAVTTPHSTTDLARELGQTPPAVNVHLAILRRSGLVTSRRAGRRVLYRTTPLAHSILDANRASH